MGAATVLLSFNLALAQDGEPETPAPQVDEAVTPQEQGLPVEADGPFYPVSALELQYVTETEGQPPLEDVMQIEVRLGHTEQGFVAPRADVPLVTVRLADIPGLDLHTFYASAIQGILEQIRDHFLSQDLMGVYVAPDPSQIDEAGQDLRPDDVTSLQLLITTGVVTELRTIASGDRVPDDERLNNPLHQRIRDRSPVQPYREGEAEGEGEGEAEGEGEGEWTSLLRKDEINRYIYHLSRHPGRRVDIGLAAGLSPGGAALDYIITENNPLSLYAQVANTGTKETNRWRERFGLFHTQLTNNDDILSVEYSTAGFDDVHAFAGSYEAPFPDDRIRWRVQGTWSEFTASEVGFFRDFFRGDSWTISGEVAANIYQNRDLFLDLVGGARFQHIHVDNRVFLIEGEEDFFIPYLGLRLERGTEAFNTRASLTLEWQVGDITDVDVTELDALGRTDPDEDWVALHWNFRHSFYLEPVLDREAWEDPTTPESSTLAHELVLGFRGQYAFDNRLIPQEEGVLGGLYTVRGYPQSIVAGDTTILGSIEYRYHVPRAFDIEPEPQELFGRTFRAAPQQVYGYPDWDLLLKGFLDVGRVIISDPFSFEDDETLIGVGIGMDLNYRRNFRLRLDWGFVLDEIESRDVNSGSNRLHVVATILF